VTDKESNWGGSFSSGTVSRDRWGDEHSPRVKRDRNAIALRMIAEARRQLGLDGDDSTLPPKARGGEN
jgi:hypothetical protein